jgi:hypothetical protein
MDDHMIRMMQLSQKGYVCSQIIMQLGLDMREEENPSLIRAMAGPAYGCGSGKATCGALIGGVCLLALYAAKGSDDESESDSFIADASTAFRMVFAAHRKPPWWYCL